MAFSMPSFFFHTDDEEDIFHRYCNSMQFSVAVHFNGNFYPVIFFTGTRTLVAIFTAFSSLCIFSRYMGRINVISRGF